MTTSQDSSTATEGHVINTDPDLAALGEPFAFQQEPGVWLVAKWQLTPKLGPTEGWWFPFWWEGPGTRTWRHEAPGRPPDSAARFPTPEAAAAALETSP